MVWWPFRKKRVGLVLGGGVARGIAHVGVIRVLKEAGVPIDLVVGTSSGSMIGAALAAGLEQRLIEEIALRIKWGEFFKFAFFRPGLASAEAIEEFVVKYIGDLRFVDLKVPFATVATDLRSGNRVVIREGRIAKAVAASATFPGFFAPEEFHGRHLIDGGIVGNVPVDTARELGADYVIASDAVPDRTVKAVPSDPLQMLGRALDMVLKRLSTAEAHRADVLIELDMEEDIWHLDFHKARKLITAGEVAAHRVINKVKRDLGLR